MIQSLSTDYLIRLKNSSLAENKTVTTPTSKFIISLTELLVKNGFLEKYQLSEDKRTLTVTLGYVGRSPKISHVTLFSKPGRRWYESSLTIPWGKTPQSLIIISTSSGLVSQRQAVKQHLGGEVIAEIW